MSALAHITGTVNTTSFAVAYFDASALVRDALAAGGAYRRQLLTRAQDRLDSAMRHADNEIERATVMQLVQTIKLYERKGWDWL